MQERGHLNCTSIYPPIYARIAEAGHPTVQSPELVDHVTAAWIACRPAVDMVFGRAG